MEALSQIFIQNVMAIQWEITEAQKSFPANATLSTLKGNVVWKTAGECWQETLQ